MTDDQTDRSDSLDPEAGQPPSVDQSSDYAELVQPAPDFDVDTISMQAGELGDHVDAAENESGGLIDTLMYGLSLPERTARSASAVVGGLLGETAARLIPTAFRSSRSYDVFIQQSLDMLVHDVGGVPTKQTSDLESEISEEQSGELARKAVGGMLDIAGTATMHLSPLTILALFNDIAYGSGYYLTRLSEELKREGVIDDSSTIHHASDLIEALQRSSDHAGSAFETPPFSVEGMRQTVQELSAEISKIDPTKLIPQSEVTRMWEEMEAAAADADASLWEVGSTMTMFAMNRVNLATRGALSTVRVVGNLFDEQIVDHYRHALDEIHQNGLFGTLAESSAPYIEAVWDNFESERETWTVEVLTGRVFGKAWNQIRQWWD